MLALALVAMTGCEPQSPPPVSAEVGSPLPGLSAEEDARFHEGARLFARIFTEAEGLGPRYNENSCSACHTFPVDGGTGETSVRKATRHLNDGSCDVLTPQGGENIRIQVTRRAASAGLEPAAVPAEAEHRATFTIPFTFGLGLMETVPLPILEARADPEDADGDGISGRVGRDRDGVPARFGRKADVASLADFTEGALRLEMGLTTPTVPDEMRAGGAPSLVPGVDPTPEPEVTADQVAALTDFLRFLAPPAPRQAPEDPLVARGEALFDSLGCAGCHVPVLRVGDSPSEALAGQAVALYSDLLLHDMGPELAGTCAPGASPTEWRTEPLLGLRWRDVYLHDGRATRVVDAVLLHGGEAQAARNRFAALDRLAQEAVLRFLGTL